MIVKVIAERTFQSGNLTGLTVRTSWTEDVRTAPKVGEEQHNLREIITRTKFSQKIVEVVSK